MPTGEALPFLSTTTSAHIAVPAAGHLPRSETLGQLGPPGELHGGGGPVLMAAATSAVTADGKIGAAAARGPTYRSATLERIELFHSRFNTTTCPPAGRSALSNTR